MKKTKLSIAILGVSLLGLFSCEDKTDPVNPKPGTDPQNNLSCLITAVSEVSGNEKEDSEFIYNSQGKLTRVNTKENGAITEYTTFEYNGSGKAVKTSMFNAANELEDYISLELNAAGNPATMNYFTRDEDTNEMRNITRYTYEYNAKNQITKMNMLLDAEDNGNLTQAANMTYSYDTNGNPSHKEYFIAMEVGATPVLAYTYDYTYDNKVNPVRNIPIVNIEPAGVNNLTKVVVTNKMTNTVDKLQSSDITYEYNSNGYPIKTTTRTQNGNTTVQNFTYSCK